MTYHGLGIVGDVHEGRRRFLGANSSLCLPVKNDGSDNTLLVLDGTIPMIYGTKRYNCPVQIWLMQDYPATQPTCYVKPTHDMAIKPRHVHVDGAGLPVFILSVEPFPATLTLMSAQVSSTTNTSQSGTRGRTSRCCATR